jgi:hypothetical protein
MRRLITVVAITSLALAACVTTPPPEAKTKTYDATLQEVFQAVQRVYQANGIRITSGSVESGFLNGERSAGTAGVILTGSAVNTTYDVSFYQASNRTEVQVFIGAESGGVVNELSVEMYEDFWTKLDREIR